MSTTRESTLAVLKEARRLIARPKGWVKSHYVQTVIRGRQKPITQNAYCSVGAIREAIAHQASTLNHKGQLEWDAITALARHIGPYQHVIAWNDADDTRKRDVIASFDDAIQDIELSLETR